ncbi:Nuclear segregation protein Bfr1 [Babesia duncani]|uniref:Nuclear segregation protein Bfr1 n=1 Tax=Babesia duncani TaxID=323732 RepID=A0AAD9PMQ2_9APIC|nr:Nuclear segregation protein Bfr1 [Babesia duncani]
MELSNESSGAVPKGRVGKPHGRGGRNGDSRPPRQPRPEELPFKAKIDEESRAIDALQLELSKVNKMISEHTGASGQGGNEERLLLKKSLDEIQAQIDDLEARRTKCLEALDARQKENKDKHKALHDLKASLGFRSEREVDMQIQQLEQRMMTSSMTLKEEKAMLQQLQQLRVTRASMEPLRQMEVAAQKNSETDVERSIRAELDAIRDKMTQLKSAKREFGQKLYILNEQKKKSFSTINSYFDRRTEITTKIREHVANRQKIAKELEQLNSEYYAKQQQLYQQRLQQQEQQRKKRALEVEIKKLSRQLDESNFLPYDSEIRLLQQVAIYIDKLATSGEATPQMQPADQPPRVDQDLENKIQGKILSPKDNAHVFLVAPKQKKDPKARQARQKPFKLDVTTMSYFEHVGVKAPTTLESIPECKREVQEKLQHLMQLQSECDTAALRQEIETKLANAQQKLEQLHEPQKANTKQNEADQ